MPDTFAIYRLPHSRECHFVSGAAETLASPDALCGRSGYVIAPFAIDSQTPLVLISPASHLRFDSHEAVTADVADIIDTASHLRFDSHEEVTAEVAAINDTAITRTVRPNHRAANDSLPTKPLPQPQSQPQTQSQAQTQTQTQTKPQSQATPQTARPTYSADFRLFHSQLASGAFSKLVLSRHADAAITHSPMEMFRRACDLYPRMFITLFASPWSGAWMVATPEILLEEKGGEWRTIALAGTMPLSEDGDCAWSDKNIREQRYVATYIGDSVRPFARDLQESGPRTVRAGHLLHLRSDFTFRTADTNIGALLTALHPTPAVCGLPKEEARAFILRHEHCQRRYYSGFCGPMAMDGATHLFVTLRCMSLTDRLLYAGGGLLSESDEQAEWDETESKMATMRALTQ